MVFDTLANRAVKRFSFVFDGVFFLFDFRVNKRVLTVLAGEDFIRHGYIIANNKKAKG